MQQVCLPSAASSEMATVAVVSVLLVAVVFGQQLCLTEQQYECLMQQLCLPVSPLVATATFSSLAVTPVAVAFGQQLCLTEQQYECLMQQLGLANSSLAMVVVAADVCSRAVSLPQHRALIEQQ